MNEKFISAEDVLEGGVKDKLTPEQIEALDDVFPNITPEQLRMIRRIGESIATGSGIAEAIENYAKEREEILKKGGFDSKSYSVNTSNKGGAGTVRIEK
jgi:fructose-specific phosphotransferase system component IIB